jgi:hypothetical protein
VFQFNNDNFMNAFADVLEKMKEVDSGFHWLNFAVEQMGGKNTREFSHGPNFQMKRTGHVCRVQKAMRRPRIVFVLLLRLLLSS